MRTVKRYTNTTFTHRVDHDGGRHRTPRAPAGPILCAGCGAVYENKHWTRSPNARLRASASGEPIAVHVCPGCRRREAGVPHGFLHVDGEFVPPHRDEILRLLRNETSRAAEDNPLGQVLDWGDDGTGGLLLTTTTEHLAMRLGRALEKAFDGRVLYGFSHENKLAHVWWHREEAGH
jgi:hypothetical protein